MYKCEIFILLFMKNETRSKSMCQFWCKKHHNTLSFDSGTDMLINLLCIQYWFHSIDDWVHSPFGSENVQVTTVASLQNGS